MSILEIIRINKKFLTAMRSCDQTQQIVCIIGFMKEYGEKTFEKIMTKKYFIWNLCRSKDFYKIMASIIVYLYSEWDKHENDIEVRTECETWINILIRLTLKSADNDQIRFSFIKAVERRCYVLTVETIPYISEERLQSIMGDQYVSTKSITDPILRPFVKELQNKSELIEILSSTVYM